MTRIASWMPSWHLSLIALVIGVALAWVNEHYDGWSAQTLMWRAINHAGWYWWGIPIVLSMIGLGYMARLAAPETKWGHAARITLYAGFDCYICCWGNTALGPVAAILILAGTVMVIRQQAMRCAVVRKNDAKNIDWRGVPWGIRFLISLTDKGHA